MQVIGFIGAGKCGTSLARYFNEKGIEVSGFYSPSANDNGFRLMTPRALFENSDAVFITVKDSVIGSVWESVKQFDTQDKIICHCSGSLTSTVFEGADYNRVCSVHPMLAFNSRSTAHEAIENAFFTLEGGKDAVEAISLLLEHTGNRYRVIRREDKAKYHAAACFASNFVVAVCEKAEELLSECGFDRKEAHSALVPLMRNNMDNILSCGTSGAITGPAARRDMTTIDKHIKALGDDAMLYRLLTDIILNNF